MSYSKVIRSKKVKTYH